MRQDQRDLRLRALLDRRSVESRGGHRIRHRTRDQEDLRRRRTSQLRPPMQHH